MPASPLSAPPCRCLPCAPTAALLPTLLPPRPLTVSVPPHLLPGNFICAQQHKDLCNNN